MRKWRWASRKSGAGFFRFCTAWILPCFAGARKAGRSSLRTFPASSRWRWPCLLCACWLLGASAAAEETVLTLTVGGDCVLGTREEWQQEEHTFLTVVAEKGMDWPLRNLREIFLADDMTLLNLECVLQGDSQGHDAGKQYTFRGDPAYARMLPRAGVEQVNVANNHFIDFREPGQASTLAALEAAGVAYSGFGHLYVWEAEGIRIGFGGCRETVWKETPRAVRKDILALREADCDLIIYSCHWGREYSPTHNRTQERMADYAIQCGANILIGAHPHVVQGVEKRNGALVLWSLGNLVFGGTHDMTTFDAMLAQLELHFRDGEYTGVQLRLLPVLTSGAIPVNDFSPVLAQGEDKKRILEKVAADSPGGVADVMWFVGK